MKSASKPKRRAKLQVHAPAQKKDKVRLSIVICTYNRHDLLPEAIRSIEQQTLPPDSYELIVVDNSSDIEAREDFAQRLNIDCNATFIIEDQPGLSRARNIGVNRATGVVVAFIDDDAIADSRWAEEILNSFSFAPNIGIVGGPVRPIWPDSPPSWLDPRLNGFLTIVDRGSEMRELNADEWLAGTNIAYMREPLMSAGGFSEALGRVGNLLLSNEELVASNKLRDDGYHTVYNPQQVVKHRIRPERLSQAWLRQRAAWQVVSNVFADLNVKSSNFAADVHIIQEFLSKMPARYRSVHGLFADISDPDLFQYQTVAISALTRLLMQDTRDWQALLNSNK